jgi:GAF domain-containing protein
VGLRASVGAPVVVHGELWGAVVGATKDASFPPGAEQRVAAFAELVAQALANAEAREELAASRKRLVEALGGRLEVRSPRDRGTTVRAWLPESRGTGGPWP